ncbi:MAG: DNA-processing protein DprA [Lachnospiraceae bacterium]|nr:DNA-processing protein DprA [Lachnospiraceae bacterium]
MTKREYWLYLARIKGLEAGRRNILLDIFGGPEEIYKASEHTLRGIPLLEDYHIHQILSGRNMDYEREAERIDSLGISFVTTEDKDFPDRLRQIPDSPAFLFYKGKLPEETSPAVAIIGSRKCSFYGREMCIRFSRRLSEVGIIIVSGMAAGVDGFAHRGALDTGGRSVAVLGCGVDICYPSTNKDIYDKLGSNGSSIISEYYPQDPPLPYNFPQRNRIISGLSDLLLVIEAGRKSGTFITVDHALEQGKEIFAIPGRVGDSVSDGCNSLIKNGAHLATEPEDLINELKNRFEVLLKAEKALKKRKKSNLSDEEKKIYDNLSYHPVQIDELSGKTGIPGGKISALLIGLEMKELIEEVGKNQYIRKG